MVSSETVNKKWKKAALRNAECGQIATPKSSCGENLREKEEGHSDNRSRGLSHHSTRNDADGLDFRVRNGTG